MGNLPPRHIFYLHRQSSIRQQAEALQCSGVARLQFADSDTLLNTCPADSIFLDAALVPDHLGRLLGQCKIGSLGDVAILVESEFPDFRRIGFRARPWLSAIYMLPGAVAPPKGIEPAPIVRVTSAQEIHAIHPPPPISFTEIPSVFPPKLQIQTSTKCSAGCEYCPKPAQSKTAETMDPKLFDRILDQCSKGRPSSLELYFHAEPLQDDRLERLATQAKKACPDTLIQIITNLSALSTKRAISLAGSGLDVLFVSVNLPETENPDTMARQLDRLTSTQSAMRQAGKELVIVTLGNLLSSEALAQFQQQCAKRDLPLTLFRATSRLGDAPIDALVHPDACPPSRRCERPFTKFYIRYNGDVVLCCEDWQYRTVLGNLTRDSITDVWQSAGYKSLRKGHLTGQTPFPCTLCDYVSD